MHALTQPLNGVSAVQQLITGDHHGSLPQGQSPLLQGLTQGCIGPPIADDQSGNAAAVLTQARELAAEQAAPVVDEGGSTVGGSGAIGIRAGGWPRLAGLLLRQ